MHGDIMYRNVDIAREYFDRVQISLDEVTFMSRRAAGIHEHSITQLHE